MPDNETGGDLFGTLASLMEHPEIRNLITSLKSPADGAGADAPAPAAEAAPAEEAQPSQPALPALPPELLARLPGLLAQFSKGPQPAKASEKEGTADRRDEARRTALLQALRPYLNPKRQAVLDGMLQLGDLAKLFGTGEGR